MTTPPLMFAGVDYVLGRTPILSRIDLVVEPGEVVGIAGPNGAGKSTLLSLAATLIRPSSGTVKVFGVDAGSHPDKAVRYRIGWSGHDPGLYPELTLAENLDVFGRLHGKGAEAVHSVLEQVGLGRASDRRASAASNGMQRRVDLARILIGEPELVLLDEADAGLDDDATVIVDHIVRQAVARGGAAVLVSHDATTLSGRASRLMRLESGRLS